MHIVYWRAWMAHFAFASTAYRLCNNLIDQNASSCLTSASVPMLKTSV